MNDLWTIKNMSRDVQGRVARVIIEHTITVMAGLMLNNGQNHRADAPDDCDMSSNETYGSGSGHANSSSRQTVPSSEAGDCRSCSVRSDQKTRRFWPFL